MDALTEKCLQPSCPSCSVQMATHLRKAVDTTEYVCTDGPGCKFREWTTARDGVDCGRSERVEP